METRYGKPVPECAWTNAISELLIAPLTVTSSRKLFSPTDCPDCDCVWAMSLELTAPLPVAARGVAMATELLTDGLGPVYNPYSRVSLAAALETAIAQLDPALPLMGGSPPAVA